MSDLRRFGPALEPFGHEKLIVYQKGMRFVMTGNALLKRVSRRVAACDHLERGAESVLLNIAHASSTWSPKERAVFLGYANGSTLECAACLDVLVAKDLLSVEEVHSAKLMLVEIVSMLIALRKRAASRVSEEYAAYRTTKGRLFDHEDLEVYQVALRLVAWIEPMRNQFSCSTELLAKLDKSTTSVVLNIAEGNGRFSGMDRSKFIDTAFKATIQSAALLDLATVNGGDDLTNVNHGRDLLRHAAAKLAALAKVVANE